jgi:hypothetical protein
MGETTKKQTVCVDAKCEVGGDEKCCHECDKFPTCGSGWKCESPDICVIWREKHP